MLLKSVLKILLINSRALPDITSGLEVWQIFKIGTVRKLGIRMSLSIGKKCCITSQLEAFLPPFTKKKIEKE